MPDNPPLNLLFVTVDCLRNDHTGFGGQMPGVTPFLDSLAAQGIAFTHAVAAGIPTYFSFPAIMASRFPLALGRDVLGVAPGEQTLALSLSQAGFDTAAFTAGNPYVSRSTGYAGGFDVFEDYLATPVGIPEQQGAKSTVRRRLDAVAERTALTRNLYRELRFRLPLRRSFDSHRLRLYPPADRLAGSAINWLSRRAQASPFLLWLHFMDPHHPYYPPAEALDSIGRPDLIGRQAAYLNSLWGSQDVSFHRLEKVREDVMALYRAGVLWVDMQISRLVRELQRLGQWDRTVFVVLGDHGEEFLEHRGRQHYPLSLHRELTHVPLMICHPAHTDAHSVDLPFSLVDLAPTVLRMLGMPVPASFAGQSRWQNGRLISVPDQAVITEAVYDCCSPGDIAQRLQPRILSVQDAGFKLIMNFANDTEHFYDLASDPQEQVPLAANDRTPARRRMLSLALDHVRSTGTDLSNPDRLRARLADIRRRL